jgi:hypothetical protein
MAPMFNPDDFAPYDVGDGPRAVVDDYHDCDCPDREAIVTPDGLVCGTCGVPIDPDPRLVVD